MYHPTDRIAHTTAFVAPVVEHWMEREIALWVHPMKDRSDDLSHHERTLLPRSYISIPSFIEMRTFLFGLILRDIPNSLTPQTTLRLLPIPGGLLVLPCTHQCRRSPFLPPTFFPVPDRGTGEGRFLCP